MARSGFDVARLRTLKHKLVELGIRAAGQEPVQLHQKPHVQVLADRGLASALLRRLTATSLDVDTHLPPESREPQRGELQASCRAHWKGGHGRGLIARCTCGGRCAAPPLPVPNQAAYPFAALLPSAKTPGLSRQRQTLRQSREC